MFRNTLIKGIETYLPGNKIGNEKYIEHFDKQDIDIRNLLASINRKYRYKASDDENVITMGTKASLKVLKNFNEKAEDIDIIIFASNTPEYLTPSNAIKIHHTIGAKIDTLAFDVNADCMGAILAINLASTLLKGNPKYKKALVVASTLMSAFSRQDDALAYATMSDAAVSILLEAKEEEFERGILSTECQTDSRFHDATQNPIHGFSSYLRSASNDKEEGRLKSYPFDTSEYPTIWANMIKNAIANTEYKIANVKFFIMSQFVEKMIVDTLEKLNVENYKNKYNFLTPEIGYTGLCCEMFALKDAIDKKLINEGDLIVLGGTGIGSSNMMMSYKL